MARHSTTNNFFPPVRFPFFSFFSHVSSMSKGEIDILLNPHNLLIKIIISSRVVRCGGGTAEGVFKTDLREKVDCAVADTTV